MLKLTKELLTSIPEAIAKEAMQNRNRKASSTQIRKFYDDFLLLHTKSHREGFTEKEFNEEILPLIAFSKAKLAYSFGRGIINKKFMDEISNRVDAIEELKDFDNFILFYQALIGYTKYYEKNTVYKSSGNYNKNYQNTNYKKSYNKHN